MISFERTLFATTDEDDLPETIRELSDVAASWRNIGTQLGIRHNRLEAIQGDKPLDCLRQMLATWLQKNYNVKRFGEPTWMKLVEVVSHSAGVGNPSLALEIAKKHKGAKTKQTRHCCNIVTQSESCPFISLQLHRVLQMSLVSQKLILLH